MTRAGLREVVFMLLGGLCAIAVLAPQLVTERARADRLERNETVLAHRCVIRPNGAVESCPPGSVHVDRVVAR